MRWPSQAVPSPCPLCSLTSFSYSHPQALPAPQASHTLVHVILIVPSAWNPCPAPPSLAHHLPLAHTHTGKPALPTLHPRLGWRPLAPVFPVRTVSSVSLCYALLKYQSYLDCRPSADLHHWHERHIQPIRPGVGVQLISQELSEYLSSFSLSFFICKIGVIIEPILAERV